RTSVGEEYRLVLALATPSTFSRLCLLAQLDLVPVVDLAVLPRRQHRSCNASCQRQLRQIRLDARVHHALVLLVQRVVGHSPNDRPRCTFEVRFQRRTTIAVQATRLLRLRAYPTPIFAHPVRRSSICCFNGVASVNTPTALEVIESQVDRRQAAP